MYMKAASGIYLFHCIHCCDQFCSAVSVDSPSWLAKWFRCKGYNLIFSLISVHLFLYCPQKLRTVCLRLSIDSLPWFGDDALLTSLKVLDMYPLTRQSPNIRYR
jgi:hypothetical protein